ncbi:protein CCSMST1-like [Heterodontus francisci]|uniref:protein CCSMST1-like n=1 Tax=Heterodontus francisci TaxID=7792 RepID=UPI00355B2182
MGMRMIAASVGFVRVIGIPSSSTRQQLGAAFTIFAEQRNNNAAKTFFSTTPGEHNSSPKDNKSKSDDGTIKFSTSKASYRVWTVDNSLGSDYQNPWWKVLPLSLAGIAFLLWCFLRKESEIDKVLERTLLDHFPDFNQPAAEPEEHAEQRKITQKQSTVAAGNLK